jgi:DNA-binding LacI/PurR family transcriptional regulator
LILMTRRVPVKFRVKVLTTNRPNERRTMAVTSIKEVARQAGVSVGTVSNVLNRPDMVAPARRQRVLDVIDKLGFVRNESARQLRAGRSRTIGLVVIDVANPFFTDVARGVESITDESNSMLMLCNSGEDREREARHLEMLEQLRVLGILITPVDSNDPLIDEIASRGTPVVLVDRRSKGRTRCSVGVNDVLGGRVAVEHLLAQGHRRIAFVGGPFSLRQVSERHQGARGAIADQPGAPAAELSVVETTSLTVAAGRAAAVTIAELPARRRPTAAFCGNDLVALGVLQEMTRRGTRIPQDLALVGYDDIEFAGAAAVPLTSVRQPREALGRTAGQLLLEEVEDGASHRHRHVVFDPELVVRESSSLRIKRRSVPPPVSRKRASVTQAKG